MCTRYYMELSPELRPIIEEARRSPLTAKMISSLGRPLKTEGEIRPTDIAPVIAPNGKGVRTVYPMVWGFNLPDKENTKRSKPLINARMESANYKQTFRDSWARRRCIIPASYYYEWDHVPYVPYSEKGISQPMSSRRVGIRYAIQPEGETVTYLAGLYRMEEDERGNFPHFTVLTREPVDGEVKRIHDRMPVILSPDIIDEWINPWTDLLKLKEISWNSLTDMVCEKQKY